MAEKIILKKGVSRKEQKAAPHFCHFPTGHLQEVRVFCYFQVNQSNSKSTF